MGTPSRRPSSNQPQTGRWQRHGNTAQWFAVIAACILGIINIAYTWYSRSAESDRKTSDEHINALIGDKLDPAIRAINESVDKKLEPINSKLGELLEKIGDTEGQLKRLRGNPKKVLGTISAEIRAATDDKKIIPATRLAAYKDAIHKLSPSDPEFWPTVAAIINYDSFVNQKTGKAPDPKKVSKPCGMLTQGEYNAFIGGVYENCVVNLDTQVFQNVVFKNSVIRYHGQRITLINVQFVNCSFILDLPPKPEPEQKLLFALLDSPDQKTVKIN